MVFHPAPPNPSSYLQSFIKYLHYPVMKKVLIFSQKNRTGQRFLVIVSVHIYFPHTSLFHISNIHPISFFLGFLRLSILPHTDYPTHGSFSLYLSSSFVQQHTQAVYRGTQSRTSLFLCFHLRLSILTHRASLRRTTTL